MNSFLIDVTHSLGALCILLIEECVQPIVWILFSVRKSLHSLCLYWDALHFPWMHMPASVHLELTPSILSQCEFFCLWGSLHCHGLTLVLTVPGNRWVAQTGCHEPWVSTQFSLKRLYLSPDVNECVTNTHRCNLHAECLNTEGSFQCKCKQGYRGSGFDCAGEYHWMSGIVLYCFSPITDHYKARSQKRHAEQCCNANQERPLHKIIY